MPGNDAGHVPPELELELDELLELELALDEEEDDDELAGPPPPPAPPTPGVGSTITLPPQAAIPTPQQAQASQRIGSAYHGGELENAVRLARQWGARRPRSQSGEPRMESVHPFEHTASFEQGEVSGNVTIGKFEAAYEELFSEVIEDGVITVEERARLDKAADSLGLDRSRLHQLEQALSAAYEARHRVIIKDLSDEPRASLQPIDTSGDPRIAAMQRRIETLEQRVRELQDELEEARAHVAVEVDLSDVSGGTSGAETEDVAEIQKRIRRDPRDPEHFHALFRAATRAEDTDRVACAAAALVYLQAANAEEKEVFRKAAPEGTLIRPTSSVTAEAWRRLLSHPDQEALVGDIFSVVVSAVLLGRVAALRHTKALPTLDADKRQDAKTSTVQAVRCFAWGASILGMTPPALYTDPMGFPGVVEMVPGVPPASRLGKLALSGRTPSELAFVAGRHLAWYRSDHFVRLLVPSIPDLEDVFLAALNIGNPGLPLSQEVKRRVGPIANAIQPILEAGQIDRLRGAFLRFVEEGGRTNLQRWATSVEATTSRAGFVLCGDLRVAERMLDLEKAPSQKETMDDLLVFSVSDRYASLRKQIGIAG
jgi:hypothetical protein